MEQAALANLLDDCLVLWGVGGRMRAEADGLHLAVAGGEIVVSRGAAPLRWMLQTPSRAAAGRGPRGVASVVALLAALRAALGVEPGARLMIGAGAGMAAG